MAASDHDPLVICRKSIEIKKKKKKKFLLRFFLIYNYNGGAALHGNLSGNKQG